MSPSPWPWIVVIGYCTVVAWIDSPGFLDDTFQSEIRQLVRHVADVGQRPDKHGFDFSRRFLFDEYRYNQWLN